MKAKQQVHVVYGLARSALDKIVDHRCDEQLAVDLLKMQDALVGINNILQVGSLVGYESKVVVGIVILIECAHLLDVNRTVEVHNCHYASCKATAHRNKINLGLEARLQLAQRLAYLGKMLMLERLVDRHIVVAP